MAVIYSTLGIPFHYSRTKLSIYGELVRNSSEGYRVAEKQGYKPTVFLPKRLILFVD
jgi:hypothetical protein